MENFQLRWSAELARRYGPVLDAASEAVVPPLPLADGTPFFGVLGLKPRILPEEAAVTRDAHHTVRLATSGMIEPIPQPRHQ